MATDVAMGAARADELPQIVAALDAEFVTGKGRSLSMARRFPAVYAPERASQILVARDRNRILGVVAIKRRSWRGAALSGEVIMVGGVYTDPAARGRGVASGLLKAVVDQARASGASCAVLWTHLHGFYDRLGWRAVERGRFGKLARAPLAPAGGSRRAAVLDHTAAIERLRSRRQESRLLREVPLDYRSVPLPASATCIWWAADASAYALVGEDDDRAFVYELLGEPESLPGLVMDLSKAYRDVWMNDAQDSATSAWLDRHPGAVDWQPQSRTLWCVWPGGWELEAAAKVCISYFDRI